MSTVLTNGIIIPDNGSRNWGGDLANNWNIIDLNVGYMTDVKNRVTTLENSVTTLETSVAENTANIQTNASNISALQTSKQNTIEDLETIRSGASAGATAVQPSTLSDYATKSELSSKANDSDVVHKSGNETIAGSKTFSSGIMVGEVNNSSSINIHANTGGRIYLRATNASNFPGSVNIYTYSDNDDGTINEYSYYFYKTQFYPANNTYDLGSTARKWNNIYANTFNGINPGALSLPSNNAVNILSALQSGGYTAPSNGYVRAIKNVQTECASTFGIRNETTGIEDRRISERIFVLGVIVPVQAREKVIISDDWNSASNATITYSASFYPCKGNV